MNKRKILILSDLEGILGVDSIFNTKSNVSKYQREVSAYLQVASKLGYEVFYCDMHGNGTMVGWNDKESPFRIIAKEKLKCELSQTCFNCAAMIGFHAKAGSDGVLSHTFTDEVLDLRIGGESAGEIEIIALWLWKYRIPVAFLSGRREAQEEAERIGCTFHANEVENDGIYTIEECLRRGTMLFERTLQDGSYDAGMIWGNNNFTKKIYVILRGEFYDDELSRCGYRIVSPATIEFESPSDFMCAAENFFSQVYLIRCRWLLSGIRKLSRIAISNGVNVENIAKEVFQKDINRITKEDLLLAIKELDKALTQKRERDGIDNTETSNNR